MAVPMTSAMSVAMIYPESGKIQMVNFELEQLTAASAMI
jgi:hypothetical protein